MRGDKKRKKRKIVFFYCIHSIILHDWPTSETDLQLPDRFTISDIIETCADFLP